MIFMNSCSSDMNSSKEELWSSHRASGNLGPLVNSPEDEFLPNIYNDTLYFRRIRAHKGMFEQYDVYWSPIHEYKANLIRVLKNTNYEYLERSVYFPALSVNTETPNFITVSEYVKIRSKDSKIRSYRNKLLYNDLHPAISPDGTFIVFASDRPGGYGGTDLYICYRFPDNTWSKPINLGDKINTIENEISPFIAEDGSLFFASKGYNQKFQTLVINENKDYNIIKAEPVKNSAGKWVNPKALPYPINTEYNEIGPTVLGNSKIYFASDRPGGYGKFDIYGFDLYNPLSQLNKK
jgi:hypothetical protein